MFTTELCEKYKEEIYIHEIDAECLENLIEYAYTGTIMITTQNAQNMLSACSLLQVSL